MAEFLVGLQNTLEELAARCRCSGVESVQDLCGQGSLWNEWMQDSLDLYGRLVEEFGDQQQQSRIYLETLKTLRRQLSRFLAALRTAAARLREVVVLIPAQTRERLLELFHGVDEWRRRSEDRISKPLTEMWSRNMAQQKEINSLRRQVEEKDREIARLYQQVAEREQTHRSMQGQLYRLSRHVNRLVEETHCSFQDLHAAVHRLHCSHRTATASLHSCAHTVFVAEVALTEVDKSVHQQLQFHASQTQLIIYRETFFHRIRMTTNWHQSDSSTQTVATDAVEQQVTNLSSSSSSMLSCLDADAAAAAAGWSPSHPDGFNEDTASESSSDSLQLFQLETPVARTNQQKRGIHIIYSSAKRSRKFHIGADPW